MIKCSISMESLHVLLIFKKCHVLHQQDCWKGPFSNALGCSVGPSSLACHVCEPKFQSSGVPNKARPCKITRHIPTQFVGRVLLFGMAPPRNLSEATRGL